MLHVHPDPRPKARRKGQLRKADKPECRNNSPYSMRPGVFALFQYHGERGI